VQPKEPKNEKKWTIKGANLIDGINTPEERITPKAPGGAGKGKARNRRKSRQDLGRSQLAMGTSGFNGYGWGGKGEGQGQEDQELPLGWGAALGGDSTQCGGSMFRGSPTVVKGRKKKDQKRCGGRCAEEPSRLSFSLVQWGGYDD